MKRKEKNLSSNHVEKMSLIYRKSHPKIQPMIVLLDSGDNESSVSMNLKLQFTLID